MRHWARRQLYLADYTLAALARRRTRNLSLLVIFALVVFVLASATLFAGALRHEAQAVLARSPELLVQRLVMGRHDLIDGAALAELGAIRGVARAEGRLWGYFHDATHGANYTMMVAADPALIPPPGKAIVGEAVPRIRDSAWAGAPLFLSRGPGDLVRLDIARTLPDESALVSADLVLLNEADFRAFFRLPEGVYTDLALTIRNPREVDTVVAKAARILPEARFVTRSEIARTYHKIFDWREGMLVALAGASVLAFAIFAAEKASGLSAEETREIGILKAIGWDSGDIIAMKLWEGALIAVTAWLAGVLLAWVHVFWLGAPLIAPVLKGWAVIYPDFRLSPQVEPMTLATLFVLTVVPYTAAVLVPIWRAASADPDAVMR